MDQGRTWGYTTAGEALTQLLLDIFRLNGRLLISGDRLVADIGLTSARWQVLGAIGLAEAALPVAHVARNMGLTRQAVQRIVNELAAEGLIEFAANPHHRRAKLVLLTAEGRRLYQAALQRQMPWVNGLAGLLDKEKIATATHVIRTLIRQLEESQAEPLDDRPAEKVRSSQK
jgi:DNA-binding MarR family transcriptional regulator